MHTGLPVALALGIAACTGLISDPGAAPGEEHRDERRPPVPDGLSLEASTAIPRLSRREIERTVTDVFGIEGAAIRNLPPDPRTATNPRTEAEDDVFDTYASTKVPGQVFVEGLEAMAFEIARDFTADTARVDALAGCTPEGGTWDAACLESFLRELGRRLFRRPVTDEEASALVAAASPFGEENGHYVAARMVVSSLLMSPDFVYRTEIGGEPTMVDGEAVHALDNYELVSRLAYFFWGTTPTEELLDRAAVPAFDEGTLEDMVREMAADPRTDAQMRVFHEAWLRYGELLVTDEALATDMRAETEALVDRALGDTAPWTTLFTSRETFVTPALAAHYGLESTPSSSAGEWVPYGDDGRAGVLAHGSFLSLSSTRITETLPSRRGAMIARRVLCMTILPPPPEVSVDMGVEVAEDACKHEAYAAHRASGSSCNGCHAGIDPIGFGLERYNGLGQYREVEEANPACTIDAAGVAMGEPFSGPRELADVLDRTGAVSRCAVDQLVRFATRGPTSDAHSPMIDRLHDEWQASGESFRELMIAVALDPSFRYRKSEAP